MRGTLRHLGPTGRGGVVPSAVEIVPRTTPNISGVMMLLPANTSCQVELSPSPSGAILRKTKEEPRSTIPTSITVTGM